MPNYRRDITRLKEIFHLKDWRIRVREAPGTPDRCGDVDIEPDFRVATITLYPEVIAASHWDNLEDTLIHEFGEIVAAQASCILPADLFDSDQMMRVRDRLAEHLTMIVKELTDV